MKAHALCGPCLVHWVFERALGRDGDESGAEITRSILKVLLADFSPSANLGLLCNLTVDAVSRFTAKSDGYYRELKEKSDRNAKELLEAAARYIKAGRTKRQQFERACFLAAAANVAPLNPPSGAYTFDEMGRVMEETGAPPLVVGDIYGAARKAGRVLYITDNAGEIGFDSLVVRMLKDMGAEVTLVVKDRIFFEDATMDDARFFGLNRIADRVVKAGGFFVRGTLTAGLREAWDWSDLVIAKGTGSYEALGGETGGKPAIFMLKVKCGPIAEETGISRGNMVVKLHKPRGNNEKARG